MDDSFRNSGNLRGSFALAEDNFRKPLADAAVMVDACEPQVLKGAVAQKLKEPGLGSLRRYSTRVDRLEKGQELWPGHRDTSLPRVDFHPSWAIKYSIVPCDGFIFL